MIDPARRVPGDGDDGEAIPEQIACGLRRLDLGIDGAFGRLIQDQGAVAYLNPPLTSVRSSGEEIGRQAGRLVIERLATPTLPLRRVQIEAKLVVRESTARAV